MASQHQQHVRHHLYHPHHFYGYSTPQPSLYHEPTFTSLAYRPVPLQQERQQQLSLAAAAASGLHFPTAVPNQHQFQIPVRTPQQSQRAEAVMAETSYPTEEELAEMQKLSNEYQPKAEGPLVGQRLPSTAITTEYATADPVYQAKTAALPQKYSHYRTVRGDGSCGWRAIAFGYYELLVRLGDPNKFLEEETRLRSLSNVLNAAGFEESMYEDFADEVFTLMRRLAAGLHDGTAESTLYETFNDESTQNYIITHFRTLTAAWMKTHHADYSPWVINQTIDQFCNISIMPVASELENVSLGALKDVLLSPAGITLEVLYLDRSEGSEVNSHSFSPINHNGYDIGTIRVLYRPGHYDLIYLPQDLPPSSMPAVVPTYLQYASQPYQDPVSDLGMHDLMSAIPGMSYANPHSGWMSSSSYADSDFFAMTTPVQQCAPPLPTPSVPAPVPIAQPQMQPAPVFISAAPAHLVPPPTQMPEELVIRTVPHSATSSHLNFQNPTSSGPFRPSHWEFESEFAQHVPLQTAIFKNSHFNTAHFMNPDFQPEEWHPEDEYVTGNARATKHRNSG